MRERRLLQAVIAVGALVPISGGLGGILKGGGLLAGSPADTHFAYLSGLLLAIGLAFWASIPRIEAHGARVSLLAALVVTGGCARLLAIIASGITDRAALLPLAMELGVTPALWLWQRRVARLSARP
jgi:hypothetical protein